MLISHLLVDVNLATRLPLASWRSQQAGERQENGVHLDKDCACSGLESWKPKDGPASKPLGTWTRPRGRLPADDFNGSGCHPMSSNYESNG